MTQSFWRRTNRAGALNADITIVGAGIAGISAALHLQRKGVRAVVVDRRTIGSGASTRNAGFLMRGAADNYAAAARAYTRPATAQLWRWTEENLAGLRAEGIESLPSYAPRPSCLLALDEREHHEIIESRRMLEEDGFEVGWIDGLCNAGEARDVGLDTAWQSGLARAGLINPHDAVCNPYELISFLASRLTSPPIEHQEALAIDTHPSHLRLTTTDGAIDCERILLCTNAYTPLLLPELAHLISPRRGQMLAMRARGRALAMAYYANHGSEYFRQADADTIVVGGWRTHDEAAEVGYEDRTTPAIQSGLESFARTLLGEPIDVTARWSGVMGFTPDGLPLLGPVESRPDWAGRVWLCAGFTGHGMSMAYRTAAEVAEAILAQREPVFSVGRFRSFGATQST